ncbi:hypothetical protein PPL_09268 [Heterostelium album PN500]|uniref:Uncharacterized protein n=1 Tax=Heterostelium pallidum (strain ATCC 26659 / Pp 5 / PN500) TaxID=670386 RepID=D3BL36_HETP5|nr:hypothetical protein PPL_09268 [Heterostelium album PN500]EFA77770.1 hypothetical protein PPL_09268 [Heterostelium album PN500]|eukprot:XP_020429898.1 hypothetical protein PPL_09268 [Heterostelium album PN500]
MTDDWYIALRRCFYHLLTSWCQCIARGLLGHQNFCTTLILTFLGYAFLEVYLIITVILNLKIEIYKMMSNRQSYLFILTFVFLIVASCLAFNPDSIDGQTTHHTHDDDDLVGHNCIHDKINHNVKLSSGNRNLKADPTASTHPIRLVFNTTYLNPGTESQTCYQVGQVVILDPDTNSPTSYTCKQSDILTPELVNLFTQEVLPFIASSFSKYLTVSGTARNSYSRQFRCIEEYVMDITNGFEGDFINYVSVHPIASSGTIAYATSCLIHSDTGAPFAGIINFSPFYFSPFANATYRQQNQVMWNQFLRVGLHEATHSLGFSSSMYDSFYDRTTGNRYKNNIMINTTTTLTTPAGVSFPYQRFFITSPSVLHVARNHFGCQSLVGAELENIGGPGTAGSHWKSTRFGEGETLIVIYSQLQCINMTLSCLNLDSGWYGLLNLGESRSSSWGKGMGCDFADKLCTPAIWSREGYWPATNNQVGCSASRSGIGMAFWADYNSNLPYPSQHFTNPKTGGASQVFDCCVWNMPSQYCFDTSRKTAYEGEVNGADSFCFKQQLTPTTFGYGCRPQRCQGLQLQVQFNGKWSTCPAGETLILSANTTLVCPNDNTCSPTAFPSEPSSFPNAGAATSGSPLPFEPIITAGQNTSDASTFQINFIYFVILFISYLFI